MLPLIQTQSLVLLSTLTACSVECRSGEYKVSLFHHLEWFSIWWFLSRQQGREHDTHLQTDTSPCILFNQHFLYESQSPGVGKQAGRNEENTKSGDRSPRPATPLWGLSFSTWKGKCGRIISKALFSFRIPFEHLASRIHFLQVALSFSKQALGLGKS